MGRFQQLGLEGACLVKSHEVRDNRGSFVKYLAEDTFHEIGMEFKVSETILSSSAKNVIRGLHFQISNPQAKFVTVLKGRVYDVIVDLRMGSPTFKRWLGVWLDGEGHDALFVPPGFAHGFVSLEDGTLMLYQCHGAYDKETDAGIRFDDSEISIDWPIAHEDAILSDRDLCLMSLKEYMRNPMKVRV